MTVWTVSRNEMKTGAGRAQYMASSDNYRPSISLKTVTRQDSYILKRQYGFRQF